MASQPHRTTTAPVFVPHLLKLPSAPRHLPAQQQFCPLRLPSAPSAPSVAAPSPGQLRATLTPKAPPSTTAPSPPPPPPPPQSSAAKSHHDPAHHPHGHINVHSHTHAQTRAAQHGLVLPVTLPPSGAQPAAAVTPLATPHGSPAILSTPPPPPTTVPFSDGGVTPSFGSPAAATIPTSPTTTTTTTTTTTNTSSSTLIATASASASTSAAASASPSAPSSSNALVASSPPPASASAPTSPAAAGARRRHTDEARRKISTANRGNVPWNKGKTHSEETRRKISENTRNAMRRPEIRELLKRHAIGRRHTEQTKLKIRRTSRLTRQGATSRRAKAKGPVPFEFKPETVSAINADIDKEVDELLVSGNASNRYSFTAKRPMSESTKEKLRDRIKQLWQDPMYRKRVREGTTAHWKKQRGEGSAIGDHGVAAGGKAARNRSTSPTAKKSRSSASAGGESSKQSRKSRAKTNTLALDEGPLIVVEEQEGESQVKEAPEILLTPGLLEGLTTADLGLSGQDAGGLVSGFDGAGSFDLSSSAPTATAIIASAAGNPLGGSAVAIGETELPIRNEAALLDVVRTPAQNEIISPDDLSERLERSDLTQFGSAPMRPSDRVEFDTVSVPSPSVSDVGLGVLDDDDSVPADIDSNFVPSPFRGIMGDQTLQTTSHTHANALDDMDMQGLPDGEGNDLFGSRFNSNMDF